MEDESNPPPGLWGRVASVCDRLAAGMHRAWFVWVFLIADLYVMVAATSRRPFWYDELFTLYMTRLPTMSVIWSALKDGADLNPPLFYVVTRLFQQLFGFSELVTRLPAMIGFLVMMLALYRFVSRYGSRLGGMVAMTFPLVTGGFYYAQEARGYGMELGFVATASVCWLGATRGEKRAVNLAGLALCLAGALLTHCYAVLAVAPFFVAEALRTVFEKKIDWPVWAALATPCTAVLTYLPLMHTVTGGPFDNPVFVRSARSSYEMMLSPAWWPLIVVLSIVALLGSPRSGRDDSTRQIPLYEMALVAGFAAAPVLGVALAASVTKIFMDRYGLAAILGFSIALGWLVSVRSTRRQGVGALAVLVLLGSVVWVPVDALRLALTAKPAAPVREFKLTDLDSKLPIVVANGLIFLEADHYESTEVTNRLFFLIDRAASVQYTGTFAFAQLQDIAKWLPIRSHLEDYSAFLQAHPSFYILSDYDFPMDWAMKKMCNDGLPLNFRGQVIINGRKLLLARVETMTSDVARKAATPGPKCY